MDKDYRNNLFLNFCNCVLDIKRISVNVLILGNNCAALMRKAALCVELVTRLIGNASALYGIFKHPSESLFSICARIQELILEHVIFCSFVNIT